jgi:hypothetical protein
MLSKRGYRAASLNYGFIFTLPGNVAGALMAWPSSLKLHFRQ